MTHTFPSLTEQIAVRPLGPSQKLNSSTPTRCAELATMSISSLLYRVLVTEQQAAA
jgi:hypothetical protein